MLFGRDGDLFDRMLAAADLDRGLEALVDDGAVVVLIGKAGLSAPQEDVFADRAAHAARQSHSLGP